MEQSVRGFIKIETSYSTLWKALNISYKSLENNQNQNPTLKAIKMQFKLIGW